MLSNQEKLLEFKKSIQRELDSQIAQIDNDVEAYRSSQMEVIENEALSECYRTIQTAVASIRLEFTTEHSHALSELKRQLLLRRDEYAASIFDQVRQRLCDFTGGEEYSAWMCRKLESAVQEYHPQKPTLFVREADLALGGKLTAILPGCRVLASADISIGGFIIEDEGKSYVINESLDSILEEQKEWFFSHSGLRITQL